MTAITVRVTRTHDVTVQAEYDDDDDALIAKAKGILDDGDPTNDPPVAAELCTVIDGRFDSPVATLDELGVEDMSTAPEEDQ